MDDTLDPGDVFLSAAPSASRSKSSIIGEEEEAAAHQQLMWDDNGYCQCIVFIEHTTQAVDSKQRRIKWRCHVATECADVIDRVVFTVQDGFGEKGTEVASFPFVLERTSTCISQSIDVEVEVHFSEWLHQAPKTHTYELALRPAGRAGSEEILVTFQRPTAEPSTIEWSEYEAPPGQFIARPAPALGASSSGGSWGGKWSGGLKMGRSAPRPDDWSSFPSLGDNRNGGFVMGRTHSFASALNNEGGGGGGADRLPPRSHHSAGDLPSLGGRGCGGRSASAGVVPSTTATSSRAAPPPPLVRETQSMPSPMRSASVTFSADGTHARNTPGTPPTPPSGTMQTSIDVSDPADGGVPPVSGPSASSASASAASASAQPAPAASVSAEQSFYAEVAVGDCAIVTRWLEHLGLGEYTAAFQQQLVDGKTLRTLSEADLETQLGVDKPLVRRRLLLELDALRAAAPPPMPPAVRRLSSEPARGWSLTEVTWHDDHLEMRQIHEHVQRSQRAGSRRAAETLEVVRAHRVINPYLTYKLNKTSEQLCATGQNRALPPQGGYFHGTSEEACFSICEHGFDNRKWTGGKYGVGQYLSADASRASEFKYTGQSEMLLLCEAVLGKVWHLKPHETNVHLNADKVRRAGFDSLAVPETDEIVVYLRFQAIPRYVIHFRRIELPPEPPTATPQWRSVYFCDGRYEQRLLSRADAEFAVGECTRAPAVEVASRRDVFLKLVKDRAAAEIEENALRTVGRAVAPELIATFDLIKGEENLGVVLVLEAALPQSSLHQLCRRHVPTKGGAVVGAADNDNSLRLLAEAQQVLQCVARVHAAGFVHCDIKPEHFMRFPGGGIKLVDFGSVQPAGHFVAPGNTKRYCAPEVAKAIVQSTIGGAGRPELVVEPSIDMWAVGLVLYELFLGVPMFGSAVTYVEIASVNNLALPRECTDELTEAHGRLLQTVLMRDPRKRPSAAELLDKKIFNRADDTAERRRVEVAAFFSNPNETVALNLMREIQDLQSAFPKKRRPEVRPAARLSDISRLLVSDLCPMLLAFSGHCARTRAPVAAPGAPGAPGAPADGEAPPEFSDHFHFEMEPDDPEATKESLKLRKQKEPTADAMLRIISPAIAPELRGILLNACHTEGIAVDIVTNLPHLSVVCWRTLVDDRAAKVFSRGFYTAIAQGGEGRVSVRDAFDAGRAAFLRAGFCEGDPLSYLHKPDHPHRAAGCYFKTCYGCRPPVHGTPRLVSKATLAAERP